MEKSDKTNPQHYKQYDIDAIEMMRKIWGDKKVADYCKLSAFKYRMRAGFKEGESFEDDLKKEKWFLDKYRELS